MLTNTGRKMFPSGHIITPTWGETAEVPDDFPLFEGRRHVNYVLDNILPHHGDKLLLQIQHGGSLKFCNVPLIPCQLLSHLIIITIPKVKEFKISL